MENVANETHKCLKVAETQICTLRKLLQAFYNIYFVNPTKARQPDFSLPGFSGLKNKVTQYNQPNTILR